MTTGVLAPLQSMAEPQRWRLLTELGQSDRRVGELTELLGEPQSLVSYHLRELRDAGLVTSRRSSFDGRDAYYRVDFDRCGEVLRAVGLALDPGLALTIGPPPAMPTRHRRRKPRVLFLCTGNSARSQMAEALLEHRSGAAVEARSAGTHPKPLHPDAVRVMAERGIDISDRTSRHLDTLARTRFDQVVTVCDKVREVCPEFPGSPRTAHWSIPEPDGYTACLAVADELEVRVRHLLARLASPQGGTVNA